MGSHLKKKKAKQKTTLLNTIAQLEELHRNTGSKKTYAELLSNRRLLQTFENADVQKDLLELLLAGVDNTELERPRGLTRSNFIYLSRHFLCCKGKHRKNPIKRT